MPTNSDNIGGQPNRSSASGDALDHNRSVSGDRSERGSHGGRSGRSGRGFAAMDPAQQRRIASEGGRAAHQSGHAHEFDSREAREAGRKGGETVSRNREHMSTIGRRGAEVRNQYRGGSESSSRAASSGGMSASDSSSSGREATF